jgi:hypothetical protein
MTGDRPLAMAAPSMGQFYKGNIKGSGKDGPYDCGTHRMPGYASH